MKKLLLCFLFLLYSSLSFSQLVEGFENTPGITGPLPAIWPLSSGNWAVFEKNTPATVGTGQSWGINSFASGLQYQGSNCASVSREGIGAGNTSEDYLATPSVYVPISQPRLRFFSRTFTSGNQGTIYRVCAVPALPGLQTDPTAYTVLVEWTENTINTTFNINEEKIVDLSPYVGTNIHIAFERIYNQPDFNLNGDRWLIDNVSVEDANGCNRPLNMQAAYTSYTTLNFNWVNDGHPSWEVLVLESSAPSPTLADTGIITTTNSYIFTGLTPNTSYTAYIRTVCPDGSLSNWYSITPYLPVNGKFKLSAFIDANNNGIRDSSERAFVHGSFTSVMNNAGSTSYFTSNNGVYDFPIPVPLATYDFGYQIDTDYAPYFLSGTFNFNDIPTPNINQEQILDFPILQTQDYSDTGVYLISQNPAKAGELDVDRLVLSNYSQNNSSSGMITYTKDPNTSIGSVIPSTNIVLTPTGFTYTFSNLNPYSAIGFDIYTDIPSIPTVNIGDNLESSVSISVSSADTFSANNSFVLNQDIVAAFDPNEINEAHGNKIQFDQFNQNDYLYYTIHFQNMGNANTSSVRIENILDQKIDESTLSMVNSSHNYTLQRTSNNLVWSFNNITLTPATINESQSKGYVQYRVKLKPGFTIGDIIPATASIYFDSNPAVVTETFNTEFVELLSNPTFNPNTISLTPNPTTDSVIISNSNTVEKIVKITIYDISGKRIYALNNNSLNTISIDVSHFTKGIYLIELTSDNNSKITKKLILK